MGRRKKFTKENSEKFHLLHRSAKDMAILGDEAPSPMVLVPAETGLNERKRIMKRGDGDSVSQYSSYTTGTSNRPRKDHINEFGFANDGYDYSQHFRDADGGTLVGGDSLLAQTLMRAKHREALPEEVFATGDIDPSLLEHAITISAECMDEDIHAALFDDDAECEELDDDFVTQAMAPPETPDFDFDAHMTKLLALSEQSLGLRAQPRGWEDNEGREMLAALHEQDEDGDDLSWPSGEEGDDAEDEQEAVDEERFEELMQQYEEDDEDEDAEDEDNDIDMFEGEDADGSEQGEDGEQEAGGARELQRIQQRAFHAALDEYLEQQAAQDFLPSRKNQVDNDGDNNQEEETEDISAVPVTDEDVKRMAQEAAIEQILYAEDLAQLTAQRPAVDAAIPHCQEYLRQEKVREEWDCESVLSRLSVTDNLPTVLRDKSRAPSGGTYRRGLLQPAADPSTGRAGSFRPLHGAAQTLAHTQIQPQSAGGKIVLTGRLNLPAGFAPREVREQQQKQLQSTTTGQEKQAQTPQDRSDSEDSDEDEEEGVEAVDSAVRRRGRETAEERRLRKAAVKQTQRTRRANKKQLRESYNAESQRLGKAQARDNTERVSVFRYSA